MVSERGALEPVVALLAGLLALITVAIVVLVGIRVRIEGLRTAADLSAVAAATDGSCAIATTVATRNGADLTRCDLTEGEVRVRVRALHAGSAIDAVLPEALLVASAHAALADVLPQS